MIEKSLALFGLETADGIYYTLHAQLLDTGYPWFTVLVDYKNTSCVLHQKNLSHLCTLLKQATYPESTVHPLFLSIVEILGTNPDASYFTLTSFWQEIDILFTTTHERKFVCFQLLLLILPYLAPAHVPLVLTPNFLKCYINTLSNKKSLLHPQAKLITAALIASSKDPQVGLGIVSTLHAKGLHSFDGLTKTKTIEGILSKLNVDAIESYVSHLKTLCTSDNLTKWAVEQMSLLIRNGAIIKDEGYISSILSFVVESAFFTSSSKFVREKVFSILGHLASLTLVKIDTELEGEELRKATLIAKRSRGLRADGSSWFAFTLSTLLDLKSKKSLSVPLDESTTAALDAVLAALKALDGSSTEVESIRLLMQHTALDLHSDPLLAETALDLAQVSARLFSASNSKKRKNADEPEPILVLVDLLIAQLVKDSATVRMIAQRVFVAFGERVGIEGLGLIFGVLEAGDGALGHEELFDEEEAASSESGSGSDDESEEQEEDEVDLEIENEKLREKIIAAMHTGAPEVEEELPDLDDEQMSSFDATLSTIFAQKKTIAQEKKSAKVTVSHFKLRVLDVLDDFVKMEVHPFEIMKHLIPLYASLSTSRDNASLHSKIGSVLTKISKCKEIQVDATEALEMLGSLHAKLKKCNLIMAKVYSSLSLFIVKSLSGSEEPHAKKSNVRCK